jgi:hypothetical protein
MWFFRPWGAQGCTRLSTTKQAASAAGPQPSRGRSPSVVPHVPMRCSLPAGREAAGRCVELQALLVVLRVPLATGDEVQMGVVETNRV